MDAMATIRRVIQTATFQRDAYVWMQLEPAATGDALVVVAITAVVFLGAALGTEGFDLDIILNVLLNSLIAWLLLALGVWAVARFAFQGSGEYAEVLRLVGFAFPTWLLRIAADQIVAGTVGLILGSVWFLAAVAAGMRVIAELPPDKSAAATVLGFAGWLVLQALLRF